MLGTGLSVLHVLLHVFLTPFPWNSFYYYPHWNEGIVWWNDLLKNPLQVVWPGFEILEDWVRDLNLSHADQVFLDKTGLWSRSPLKSFSIWRFSDILAGRLVLPHTGRAEKENWLYKDRGIGRGQVDFDFVWYECQRISKWKTPTVLCWKKK